MKFPLFSFLLVLLFACNEKELPNASVAFYNVENLFDTENDKHTNDEQYTPKGDKRWDDKKYQTKLENLSKVINEIADGKAPTFLGVCEIENKTVLQDLVKQSLIKSQNYGIVHQESPDERGIDVAFLYRKDVFSVKKLDVYQPDLKEYNDKTRDILHVEGQTVNGETLHFIINHWPSRGEGRAKSEPKRISAAVSLNGIKNSILEENENAKIIVMGDFNDEPSNKSISETLAVSCSESVTESNQLYNAFCDLEKEDIGSYRYRSYWDMLDQIMVSKSLLKDSNGLHYMSNSASIKAEPWMIQTGKYEGFPLRTFGGNNYQAGYSDHFPVYIQLGLK
ncbi:endonuclease/exonuclease/phosphatase family protein [Bacteroidia bacterium]|nr:endonuclease/exonuclease/phosphatase family protein [Bacteroidia bacterium]MDC1395177.1 endonuclease/exonuclease/phosphatase family protein [Bacteroidia bacterium]